MAVWAIGDVHGCLDKLIRLWDKLNITKSDTVVFLGDMIDRGPDSEGVIDFIIAKQREGYDVRAVMGNHERMCLDHHDDPTDDNKWRYWIYNGGRETRDSYGENGFQVRKDHLDFMRSLPLYVQIEDVVFVHANIHPNTPLENQPEEVVLWDRKWDVFYNEYLEQDTKWYSEYSRIVHGHTTVPEVWKTDDEKIVCIDTGACFGGSKEEKYPGGLIIKISGEYDEGLLTAYEPFENKIVQTK